jgi:hypothetical protein
MESIEWNHILGEKEFLERIFRKEYVHLTE